MERPWNRASGAPRPRPAGRPGRRYDARAMPLDPQRDALLVVDLQHDFLPGGALGVAGGDEIVAPIAALGVAASLDSLDKPEEALAAYQEVVTKYGDQPVATRARLAMAVLHESRNQPQQALKIYDDLASSRTSSRSSGRNSRRSGTRLSSQRMAWTVWTISLRLVSARVSSRTREK